MLHHGIRHIATLFDFTPLVRGVSGEEPVAGLDEQGKAREDTRQVRNRPGVPGKLYSSRVSSDRDSLGVRLTRLVVDVDVVESNSRQKVDAGSGIEEFWLDSGDVTGHLKGSRFSHALDVPTSHSQRRRQSRAG